MSGLVPVLQPVMGQMASDAPPAFGRGRRQALTREA